jgi:hypothetical protein
MKCESRAISVRTVGLDLIIFKGSILVSVSLLGTSLLPSVHRFPRAQIDVFVYFCVFDQPSATCYKNPFCVVVSSGAVLLFILSLDARR